ncbi:Acetyltransferase (GNAT) domain-containing protein [Variovorax sp. YR750]|uniref:GNAT family N-acetyltransferase n=1 Tax=Variovorax sp. YR750 TaxID=1884384 RepID=UPI0008C709F8|nr:GNAT family N-acetyltransferase [Variovorax sp. YR750]SEM54911.1 Acetyltransferase (GNAT) domain-containing protein [Variovorax sp. YR750]
MKIQVRPATADDAIDACGVIRSSILECCHDDHRGDAKVLQGWLRNKTPDFVRMVISSPSAFSVVASVDGVTVGFGSASRSGEVTLCYVVPSVPSVRFAGVGKALLMAIEDEANRSGVEALRLESTRTAREFYLRNGFVAEGPAVVAFDMEAQPMRKQLRPEV